MHHVSLLPVMESVPLTSQWADISQSHDEPPHAAVHAPQSQSAYVPVTTLAASPLQSNSDEQLLSDEQLFPSAPSLQVQTHFPFTLWTDTA